MKKKNLLKILIPIVVFVLIVTLIIIFIPKEKNGIKMVESAGIDQRAVDLIVKMDADLDRLLNVDNSEEVIEVGAYQGEIVYGLKNIPYSKLVQNLQLYMDNEVIRKEISIRGFSGVKNNLMFLNNQETQKNFLLHKEKVTSIVEVNVSEILLNYTNIEQKIGDWEEKGYFDIKYYKTEISNIDDIINKAEAQVLNSIYVVGENEQGKLIILDAIYYLNGEKLNILSNTTLNVNRFEYLDPYKFEKDNLLDLGLVDSIVERTENYQGSQPYTEQNFEENNKRFE